MEDQQSIYPASPKHRNTTKQNTSTIASEHTQPWTATRCHRLLRPLLTHIAALRKVKERRDLVCNSAGSGQNVKHQRTVLGKRSYPGSDSDYSDKKKTCRKYSRRATRRSATTNQSCTPQRNVQRQRRQPSNKGSHDVMLPTPFLRRVRNHQLSSPIRAPYDALEGEDPALASSRCTHPGSGCKTKCAFEMSLAALRSTIDAERHSLFESIFKAFDALLRVTSPRKNQAAHPKSLMAMCLRKVPAYIAGLEEWERQESEENGTKLAVQGAGVSFEIYSELESLGAVDGWSSLCLLVRAHAVRIIQDAAAEGLLEDSVTGLLIRVCLEYMPPTEFDGLIRAFVVRPYPKPSTPDDDLFTSPAHQPLSVLKSCDPSGTWILPRVLAELLAGGLLPADWILNRSFIALWPSAVRHVTHMKPCQDILDFAITTLKLLCELAAPRRPRGVPQTRLRGKPQTTLISALAALGSVVLLSEEGLNQTFGASPDSPVTCIATLRRRMNYITAACSARLKPRKTPTRKLGTYLLALCCLLSLPEPTSSCPAAEVSLELSAAVVATAWKDSQTCHRKGGDNKSKNNPALMLQYDATIALISAMAHHCGRGSAGLSSSPHAYLDRFCGRLSALLSQQQQQQQHQASATAAKAAVSGMRVDGAFRLAELTGDLRDLEVAEGLLRERQQEQEQEQQGTVTDACATPGRRGATTGKGRGGKVASFLGVRWDEGISEWVAATPGTEPRRQVLGGKSGRQSRSQGLSVGGDTEDEEDATTDRDGSEADAETEGIDDDDYTEPPPPLSTGGDGDNDDENDDDDDDDESGDESEPGSETADEDDALSPNTEASPAASVSEPKEPRPLSDETSASTNPHPAKGSLLAVRPRRLPRPITRGGDELGFDTSTTRREEAQNWLRSKKPARFRPSPVSDAATKKRAARASMVYLQPSRLAPTGTAKRRRTLSGAFVGYDAAGDSDDELSLL
ncbi:uncharacterized protein P884DRAFT_214746 [Thermothelomyces heterothallicus CBS 202.75]|uniref:uncharacterized protein n=1 Tax=Thermothelomyces heterothallicus CBS 202.75 TaxID=1149848 RepID=UPI00374435A3